MIQYKGKYQNLVISIRIMWSKVTNAEEILQIINFIYLELTMYLNILSDSLISVVVHIWNGLYIYIYILVVICIVILWSHFILSRNVDERMDLMSLRGRSLVNESMNGFNESRSFIYIQFKIYRYNIYIYILYTI